VELRNDEFNDVFYDNAEYIETQTAPVFTKQKQPKKINLNVFSRSYGDDLAENNTIAFFGYYAILAIFAIVSVFTIYSATVTEYAKLWSHSLLPAAGTVIASVAIGFVLSRVFMFLLSVAWMTHLARRKERQAAQYQFHDPVETIRVQSDYLRIVRPEYMIKVEEEQTYTPQYKEL
jgi:hypothetical protein